MLARRRALALAWRQASASPLPRYCICWHCQMWSWRSARETRESLHKRRGQHQPTGLVWQLILEAPGCSLAGAEQSCWYRTYFHRKSRGEFQGHKIPQPRKVGAGPSHEVDDGGHLLHQGQGMLLAHPQSTFEPAPKQGWLLSMETTHSLMVYSSRSYFCVRMLSSMGRPMSLFPRSKSGSKYSSGVMAVGFVAVAYSRVRS